MSPVAANSAIAQGEDALIAYATTPARGLLTAGVVFSDAAVGYFHGSAVINPAAPTGAIVICARMISAHGAVGDD